MVRHKKKLSGLIYYVNINWLRSNLDSLRKILENVKPNIVILCETKVPVQFSQYPAGYEACPRNIKDGKGGLCILLKKGTFSYKLETTHTDNRNIISVKLGFGHTPTVLISCYGHQETNSEEVRETFYDDLKFKVIQCKQLGGTMVIAGYFNAKVSV